MEASFLFMQTFIIVFDNRYDDMCRQKNMTSIAMLYVAMEHLCTNLNFYDNINLDWKERIINLKIDRFNVVELKDGNRATIIDVRGKNEYFANEKI